MAPRRVAFMTTQLGGGGAELQLVRMANQIDRSRFEPCVIVFRRGGSYERLLAPDVLLYSLDVRRSWLALPSLIRAMRRIRPHLVCSFLDVPNCLHIMARAMVGVPAASVLCVQAPTTIVHPVDEVRGRIMRAAIRATYPRADRIIAISNGVATDLCELVPAVSRRTVVIYNAGVDPDLEARAAEAISESVPRPLLVACGRLDPQKGFEYLVDAMELVRAHMPATLWIIGEGALRPALERRIEERGLAGVVRLLGHRSNPFQYYRAADVFVLSSVFEGFGNVLVEAMGCGTPIVSTDCPHGPSEILRGGRDGVLVPPKRPDLLARAILELLHDEARRRRLSERGRRRARDFSSEHIAKAYSNEFARVLAEKSVRANALNEEGPHSEDL